MYELSTEFVSQLVFHHMIPNIIKDTIFSPFHHVQNTSTASVFLNHNGIDYTHIIHTTKRQAWNCASKEWNIFHQILMKHWSLLIRKKVFDPYCTAENNANNGRLTCDATAFHWFLAKRVGRAWGNNISLLSRDDTRLSSVSTKLSYPDSIITVSRNTSQRKITACRKRKEYTLMFIVLFNNTVLTAGTIYHWTRIHMIMNSQLAMMYKKNEDITVCWH